MYVKFKVFTTSFSIIKSKFRGQLINKKGKVEILYNYWDKLYGQVHTLASKARDKATIALCVKIMMVPYDVRYEILSQFTKSCRMLYSIAFFQWRLNKYTIWHGIANNNKEEDL